MSNGLGVTVGALLIFVVLTAIGYGLTTMQTYVWYRHYPKDPRLIRFVVWSVFLLDSTHIALCVHMVYWYLVINYDNKEGLRYAVWSFDATVVVTAVITVIAHAFYARRVYILGNNNWFLALLIMIMSSIRLIFGCWVTARMAQVKFLDLLPSVVTPLVGTGMGAGSLADCIITGSLVYYLRTHRLGFRQRTDTLLDRLMYWTVNCGILTSVLGLAVIFSFVGMPGNMIYLSLHLLLSKLYANSLLVTLNFRKAHRGRGINDEETITTIPLSTLRVPPEDRRIFGKDNHAAVHVVTTTTTDNTADDSIKASTTDDLMLNTTHTGSPLDNIKR